MVKPTAHDLEISQLKLDLATARAELKDLETELKATDEKQQLALDTVKTFVNSMALALGDADDVRKMKEDARKGALSFTIVWGALASLGVAGVTTFAIWAANGGMNKKIDAAPAAPVRANPEMIGPPAPK
jgi:hypothetical protein